MLHYLKGTLVSVNLPIIVIEVMGFALEVEATKSVFDNNLHVGEEIKLLVHDQWREDKITLFGFASEVEKQLFFMLLKVSGVGPKLAIAILSTLSPKQIHTSISNQDVALLKAVKGLGIKTAKKLVVELNDSVAKLSFSSDEDSSELNSAQEALRNLGFSAFMSRQAVTQVAKEGDSVSQITKLALQYLAKHKVDA